jgi:hypothetical protein
MKFFFPLAYLSGTGVNTGEHEKKHKYVFIRYRDGNGHSKVNFDGNCGIYHYILSEVNISEVTI